jgi:hypothetical protein
MTDKVEKATSIHDHSGPAKVKKRWAQLKLATAMHSLYSNQEKVYKQMQEDADKEIKERAIVLHSTPSKQAGLDFKNEGDMNNYTKESLMMRKRLMKDPEVICAVKEFWDVLDLIKDEQQNLNKASYELLNLKMQLALMPDVDRTEAEAMAGEDWTKDTNGTGVLDFEQFFSSMFEVADIWVESIDGIDYAAFLRRLYHTIVDDHIQEGDASSALGAQPRFKSDDDIVCQTDMPDEEIHEDVWTFDEEMDAGGDYSAFPAGIGTEGEEEGGVNKNAANAAEFSSAASTVELALKMGKSFRFNSQRGWGSFNTNNTVDHIDRKVMVPMKSEGDMKWQIGVIKAVNALKQGQEASVFVEFPGGGGGEHHSASSVKMISPHKRRNSNLNLSPSARVSGLRQVHDSEGGGTEVGGLSSGGGGGGGSGGGGEGAGVGRSMTDPGDGDGGSGVLGEGGRLHHGDISTSGTGGGLGGSDAEGGAGGTGGVWKGGPAGGVGGSGGNSLGGSEARSASQDIGGFHAGGRGSGGSGGDGGLGGGSDGGVQTGGSSGGDWKGSGTAGTGGADSNSSSSLGGAGGMQQDQQRGGGAFRGGRASAGGSSGDSWSGMEGGGDDVRSERRTKKGKKGDFPGGSGTFHAGSTVGTAGERGDVFNALGGGDDREGDKKGGVGGEWIAGGKGKEDWEANNGSLGGGGDPDGSSAGSGGSSGGIWRQTSAHLTAEGGGYVGEEYNDKDDRGRGVGGRWVGTTAGNAGGVIEQPGGPQLSPNDRRPSHLKPTGDAVQWAAAGSPSKAGTDGSVAAAEPYRDPSLSSGRGAGGGFKGGKGKAIGLSTGEDRATVDEYRGGATSDGPGRGNGGGTGGTGWKPQKHTDDGGAGYEHMQEPYREEHTGAGPGGRFQGGRGGGLNTSTSSSRMQPIRQGVWDSPKHRKQSKGRAFSFDSEPNREQVDAGRAASLTPIPAKRAPVQTRFFGGNARELNKVVQDRMRSKISALAAFSNAGMGAKMKRTPIKSLLTGSRSAPVALPAIGSNSKPTSTSSVATTDHGAKQKSKRNKRTSVNPGKSKRPSMNQGSHSKALPSLGGFGGGIGSAMSVGATMQVGVLSPTSGGITASGAMRVGGGNAKSFADPVQEKKLAAIKRREARQEAARKAPA